MLDLNSIVGPSVAALRLRKAWSREQLARKLQTSATVIYNYETNRSRVPLPSFLEIAKACGVDFTSVMSRHCLAINIPTNVNSGKLVRLFRQRLRLTQGELAKLLGYASSSMVHHFEKGIRDPSVVDLFHLMSVAGDDLRGLIAECTGDLELVKNLPAGQKVATASWQEYWSLPFVPAIRQIMRTDIYAKLKQYQPGFFAKALGITRGDEKQGLEVLARCGVIVWSPTKPEVNPEMKIVIPHEISRETLDHYKSYWWRFIQKHYSDRVGQAILSVDLLPMDKKLFASVVEDIRALQEKLHNLPLNQKDGIAVFGWGAGFKEIDSVLDS